MGKEQAGVEYFSPQRRQGHIFRCRRSQSTSWELAAAPGRQKGIYRATQNSAGCRQEGKQQRAVRGTGVQELKQSWGPSTGGRIWERGEAFEATGEWSGWSVTVWTEWEAHRQSMTQPSVLHTGVRVPWYAWWLGAGAHGLESDPRVRTAVYHGAVREVISAEDAPEGKPGSYRGRETLLSHVHGVESSLQTPPTCWHWHLTNGERPLRGWPFEWCTEEYRRTTAMGVLWAPAVPNNKERSAARG